ncbi:hypothetical protein NL676_030332 [Syzygium grande]|nr:hypothetical protein NL676_030332 [Syzygium grande]
MAVEDCIVDNFFQGLAGGKGLHRGQPWFLEFAGGLRRLRPSSISAKESAYELLFHVAMGFAPCGDCWRKPVEGLSHPPVQPPEDGRLREVPSADRASKDGRNQVSNGGAWQGRGEEGVALMFAQQCDDGHVGGGPTASALAMAATEVTGSGSRVWSVKGTTHLACSTGARSLPSAGLEMIFRGADKVSEIDTAIGPHGRPPPDLRSILKGTLTMHLPSHGEHVGHDPWRGGPA